MAAEMPNQSPFLQAADSWRLAKERLERMRMDFERITDELQEAEREESQLWRALEQAAGRGPPPLAGMGELQATARFPKAVNDRGNPYVRKDSP